MIHRFQTIRRCAFAFAVSCIAIAPAHATGTAVGYQFSEFVGGMFGSVDGIGSEAGFTSIGAIAGTPEGTLYVADLNAIRAISFLGQVTTIAGTNETTGGWADGTGAEARFYYPTAIAISPAGDLIIADSYNHAIRRVTPNGVVSTIAGVPGTSGFRDGPSGQALFAQPSGLAVAVDGTIFVSDRNNHVIRKIAPDGSVSTLAGKAGEAGLTDGQGTEARFSFPQGLLLQNSRLLVADCSNHAIRSVLLEGAVSTVSGKDGYGHRDGPASSAQYVWPRGFADAGVDGVLILQDGLPEHPSFLRRLSASLEVDTPAQGRAGTRYLDGLLGFGAGPASAFCRADGTLIIPSYDRIYQSPRMVFDEPAVAVTPSDLEVIPESKWSLTVSGSTTGPMRFSWAKDGVGLPWGDSPTYQNSFATFDDAGPYTVTVTWAGGTVTSEPVTVRVKQSPTITENPQSIVLRHDETGRTHFRITTVGVEPFTYQWRKDGVNIPGATNSVYSFTAARPSDAGTYDVVVTNAFGSATSAPATLSYSDHPWISEQSPAIRTTSGTSTSVWATVHGLAPITFQWYRNGILIPGATNASFDIDAAIPADGGSYTLRASNATGSITSKPIQISVTPVNPTYTFTHLAGYAEGGTFSDGQGSTARFDAPDGIAVDSAGNAYIADTDNQVIRKMTPDGVVTVFAGTPGQRGNRDGLGMAARFSMPCGIAVGPHDELYVTDANMRTIRMITPDGKVSTVGGQAPGYFPEDGPVSVCPLGIPTSVTAAPDGTIYFTDETLGYVRKITTDGMVSTVAQKVGAHGIAIDANGDLIVTAGAVFRITPAGAISRMSGAGQGAEDGPPDIARFGQPLGITRASDGYFYITDGSAIRRMDAAGNVATIYGGPSDPEHHFDMAAGITAGADGSLLVTDRSADTINRLTLTGDTATSSAVAGRPTPIDPFASSMGYVDAQGDAARFGNCNAVAIDPAGNAYVTDPGNYVIRRITPDGATTTIAGSAGQSGNADGLGAEARFSSLHDIAITPQGDIVISDNGQLRRLTPEGLVTTIPGTTGAYGLGAADDGSFYFTANLTIRRLAPGDLITVVAGSGKTGNADGEALLASFKRPTDVAVDSSGNIFVTDATDDSIRQIRPDGMVSTLYRYTSGYFWPSSVCVDSGGVLVTCYPMHIIYRITLDGIRLPIGGSEHGNGMDDGLGLSALFDTPAGLTLDRAGNLYVADTRNCAVRKGSPNFSATPVIVDQPVSASAAAFESVVFAVHPEPDSNIEYRWQRQASGSTEWEYLIEGDGQTGVETDTLRVSPVRMAQNNDQFRCLVCLGNAMAISDAATLSVTQASQTIDFPSIPSRPFSTTPVSLSASASSGLSVSFALVSGDATLDGNTLTIATPGQITIRAEQSGDSDFAAATPVEQSFTATPSYAWWAQQALGSDTANDPSIGGPDAILGPDNATNLMKYALGVDPLDAVPADRTICALSNNDITFTFRRPADRADITYSVEASDDLIKWNTKGVVITRIATADAGGFELWEGRLPAGGSRRFLRLKVQQLD